MLKKLAIVSIVLSFAATLTACKPSLSSLLESVQRLDASPNAQVGLCTTWSLNHEQGYWVTAAHCIRTNKDTTKLSPLFINGKAVTVEKLDRINDLAILKGPMVAHIIVAAAPPKPGTAVVRIGYFHGYKLPMAIVDEIFAPQMPAPAMLKDFGIFWKVVMTRYTSLTSTPGVSGGPVINNNGHVVSIHLGYVPPWTVGTTWEQLREFTREYRPVS